jgi:(S)-2-hydroxy-acid oxidase
MAGRPPNLDDKVFCIADLKEEAGKKMDKMYKDYYNEGSMDLLT